MKKISCVIMDWAGTAVDFGCFAPLNAFLKVFSEEKGIDITYRQAREPMGLLKIDHIKAILNMPEVNDKFRARYGRDWNIRHPASFDKTENDSPHTSQRQPVQKHGSHIERRGKQSE